MSETYLLISNPPHGEADVSDVAPRFGLTPAETRMKANFRAPEIWFADEDLEELRSVHSDLWSAGLNAVLTRANALDFLPEQTSVSSFAFHEDALELVTDERTVRVPYEDPIVVVHYQPRHGAALADLQIGGSSLGARLSHGNVIAGSTGRRSSTYNLLAKNLEDLENEQFVEFYVPGDSGPTRLTAFETMVSYEGLQVPLPQAADNLPVFVTECANRLTGTEVDRRLVGVHSRRRRGDQVPDASMQRRKGYSFASQPLTKLLEGVAPGVADATQGDLMSRLVYLTKRSEQ